MAIDETTGAPDLLVTAFELIAEHGWSGLSLVTLARRAGVAPWPRSTASCRGGPRCCGR